MNQLFKIENSFQVQDGTIVSPFLNAKDAFSSIPFELLDGFSIAAGEIKPLVNSKIHIHPVVTQVTFVYEGRVTVRMKDFKQKEPYAIQLETGQAVLTKPGTFFQLSNMFERTCHVIYIVSPAYVFLMVKDRVIYDDALVIDKDWDELADIDPSRLYAIDNYQRERARALEEVRKSKTKGF